MEKGKSNLYNIAHRDLDEVRGIVTGSPSSEPVARSRSFTLKVVEKNDTCSERITRSILDGRKRRTWLSPSNVGTRQLSDLSL